MLLGHMLRLRRCEDSCGVMQNERSDSHKGVVDGNDKDVASILEVLVVDVAGDVRLGARRACNIEISRVSSATYLELVAVLELWRRHNRVSIIA